jgi:ubiquitin carboxyl-terminal hydrolase 4/11/15
VLPTDPSCIEPGGVLARDATHGGSSPSEAYANLTLESREGSITDIDRSPRRRPRASSPAKRLHSDMAAEDQDVDSTNSTNNTNINTNTNTNNTNGQPSPRPSKPLPAPTPTPQRSARATSVDMADATDNNSGSDDAGVDAGLPTIDEQVTRVMGMMANEQLVDGQEGYVISERWLERVWARTSENANRPQDFNKDATQGPIGPVDNTHLVDTDLLRDELVDQRGDDFIPLSPAAVLGQDFEILSKEAWDMVLGWYGLKKGSPVILRYAHNTVPDKSSDEITYELHPPIITVRKVRKSTTNAPETAKPAAKIVASRYDGFLPFLDAAKKAAGIDLDNKVRIWRILRTAPSDESQPQPTQPAGMLTPDASPRANGSPVAPTAVPSSLDMDVATFNALTFGTERELVTGKDEKANEEYNDLLSLADAGLTQNQVIVLEEHDEKGEYISDTTKAAPKDKTGAQAAKALTSNPNSGRNTPSTGALTRGRTRNGKVRGHVGLTNLGNTCYMNSALQCLRSVEELSMYFLSNKWKEEINSDNPIGHKGAIAKSYAGLLNSIYGVESISSFSPKNFKQTLGRASATFSGYGQQDSQEFVSWLVDALHEDLNRIHKKPYNENPDSDDNTFRDPEALKQLGETYRQNHKARNDSVAMDLFNGKCSADAYDALSSCLCD